jgi:hypothetical protein
MRGWAWDTIGYTALGVAVCVAIVWIGIELQHLETPMGPSGVEALFGAGSAKHTEEPQFHPFFQASKLVVAAILALLVTAVHKRYHGEKPLHRTLAQAQILLCVAAALMMVIIGVSVARALGVAGGASMVRFRTPVEDPKDATILFILLGIGMSCGLGNFAVAGLGSVFLCIVLFALGRMPEEKPRVMMLEVVASGTVFPSDHVHTVLGYTATSFEPREFIEGERPARKYLVHLSPSASLAFLTNELIKEGAGGIKSVAWVQPKKSD